MTNDEAKHLVGAILDRFYDGGVPIGPGDMFAEMCWGYIKDGAPTVLSIFDNEALLRITTGVVVEVPSEWSPSLFKVVSQINDSLVHGRAWADEHADGSGMFIVMQEIVPLALISIDHQPSIDHTLALLAGIPGIAAHWAPQVITRCGGKPWTNIMALAWSG